jgi:creatinine amidohydrolase/Fe(II)-dependent formamide hydrolase-like protein/sterol desaturase/sphingolipid hydroxylase (fatty acid hydroxylase superfamily)
VDYLLSRIVEPFLAPFVPSHRIYWLYLCTTAALALALFSLGGKRSLKGFLKFWLPGSVYLHRSARVDYAYFIVNRILFGLLFFPVVAALASVSATGAKAALYALCGEPTFQLSEAFAWMLLQTVLSVLAMDLGLFLAHRLQHRMPVLWEFHKVHHSAQVLNPITAYRMHPVDDLLSMSTAGALSGIVAGGFAFVQPGNPGAITVLGLNLVLFLFYLAGYNLRHSHIWLCYGPTLSRIFISPAQHQIHHSKAPRHWDKNYGFIFAFWDGWLGSLYAPRGKEHIEVGLPEREDEQYSSVARLYFLPFGKSATDGVRRASVALLALLLVVFSAQSVMIVRAAFAQPSLGLTPSGSLGSAAGPELPSVLMEDLTWTELRGLIGAGVTTAIVPTGGTEQNGPHLILGKHNHIVRHTASEVARRLGHTLVLPVIAYVPEGSIDPPSGHMRYAGTISIPERVFEALLEHTARSLKAHGFTLICFLGDSGGNQRSQQRVAERLNREWREVGVAVLHVGDYYALDKQAEWLAEHGESGRAIGFHAGIRDTSELLFVHPAGVRSNRLALAGERDQTGADGDPTKASAERGRALVELKVNAAVRQINEQLAQRAAQRVPSRSRPPSAALSP